MHSTNATSSYLLLCEFILLLQCAYVTLIFFTVSSCKDFYFLSLMLVSKFIIVLLQLASDSPNVGVEEFEFREI
jgi:hypothetical protein